MIVTMQQQPVIEPAPTESPWSNNAIAPRCQGDPKTVASVRSGMQTHSCATRKGTDGKVYDTSNIGRTKRKPHSRRPGGISARAMKPSRSHSIHYPKVALELPHDPHGACRTIVSALGNDFARALIAELTSYLQAQKAGDP